MEMKVSPQKIRSLRETRGWTQEHLAEVAGLSARTVQRIEAEGKASPESRMALAAALGVDAGELGDSAGTKPAAAAESQPPRARSGWQRHLTIYLLVCGGLVLFDLARDGDLSWSKWPVIGWGMGLLLHRLLGRGRRPETAPN